MPRGAETKGKPNAKARGGVRRTGTLHDGDALLVELLGALQGSLRRFQAVFS